jgi:DNA modification methylase
MPDMKLQNVIYCGDNLDWLRKMPDECVDLVYADPPFFSNKNYEVIFDDGAEIRSFKDRWQGGIYHYIGWMKERCVEIQRILKPTGSFYLHCDWHAGHYLKVMLDDVFGYNNFVNEIIWCYASGGVSKRYFGKKHDNIYVYSKSKNYVFNTQYRPYTEGTLKRGLTQYKKDLNEAYELHDEGAVMNDWWTDITPLLSPTCFERLGYPTQKPLALLDRIIKASSNEGDIVLDPFCGCGTSTTSALQNNRHWIGIDVSPTACKLIKRRLENAKAQNVEIIGLPMSIDELHHLEPFEFQNWVVGAMGGTVSAKKIHDMGIDGYTYINREPIQVKQSEHVGRPVVDNFRGTLERYYVDAKKASKERKDLFFTMKGVIVAFSFTSGAYEEVARCKTDHIEIELLTVKDVVKDFQV